ncbi:mycothiol conjugate amidase Mca [Amycolatopsis sp. NPDC003865]
MTYRLLSVHAHPDDESSKGAATLARYAAEGVEVLVATCTGGERGDILNPAVDTPENRADLPAVRRREMAAAAEILGIRQRFLGMTDSGLPAEGEPLPVGCFAALPLTSAAEPLVALIREFRPHVVITYDETGGYPHPDHIRTHEVTLEAFTAAADPARYPGTGAPWQPQKLYYQAALSRAWFQALHDATLAAGLESAMAEVLAEFPTDPPFAVTTKIRCEQYFATRDQALLAHRTQVDPAHPFFAHSREIERKVWPHEDYHLAHPTPGADLEDDLFAGVTP